MTGKSPLSLHTLLLVDAGTCAAVGALLTLGASPIADLTGIPAALLFYAGIALFPVAAFMIGAARSGHPDWTVGVVVFGNLLWIAGSLALLGGWISPNALGVLFIAGQALAVAVLSGLESLAWWRGGRVCEGQIATPSESHR